MKTHGKYAYLVQCGNVYSVTDRGGYHTASVVTGGQSYSATIRRVDGALWFFWNTSRPRRSDIHRATICRMIA